MKYKKWTLEKKLEVLSASKKVRIVKVCCKYSMCTDTFYNWKKRFKNK